MDLFSTSRSWKSKQNLVRLSRNPLNISNAGDLDQPITLIHQKIDFLKCVFHEAPGCHEIGSDNRGTQKRTRKRVVAHKSKRISKERLKTSSAHFQRNSGPILGFRGVSTRNNYRTWEVIVKPPESEEKYSKTSRFSRTATGIVELLIRCYKMS